MKTSSQVSRLLNLGLSDRRTSGRLVVGETHLDSEGRVGGPLGRGTRCGLLHHLVNLLQGKTLGLRNEEVSVDEGAGAEGTPDEEHLSTEVTLIWVHHVRSDDGNDAVPEPVGGSGKSDTTRTDGQGEDLADDDPGTGTPGGGEEEDVDTDEGDHGADGRRVLAIGNTDDGDDELTDNHAQGTPQEQGTTANLLNGVEGDGSGADVDDGGDHAQEEGVLDGTELLEEGGTEVEHEVNLVRMSAFTIGL